MNKKNMEILRVSFETCCINFFCIVNYNTYLEFFYCHTICAQFVKSVVVSIDNALNIKCKYRIFQSRSEQYCVLIICIV